MNSTISAFVVPLTLLAATYAPQEPVPGQSPDYRLKVDASLVLVPTTVMSPTGGPVSNLERDAFEVYENGELCELVMFERHAALPVQLVLMIDTSLSTMTALRHEQEAAAEFIREVLRPQDWAALYEFSGGVHQRVAFTGDVASLEQGLFLLRAQAGTALYDAIVEASEELRKREGRRVLVVVSDGTDTTSERDFQAALQAAQYAEVALFSLLIRPIPGESGRNMRGEQVLIAFAEMTGGQVFFPDSTEELAASFGKLRDVLGTQYLLGYRPPIHNEGDDFHRIEVRVRSGDYVVRHRRGYWHYSQ